MTDDGFYAPNSQRPAQLGDWVVCQDKEDANVKTALRVNTIDPINGFNAMDWCIADYKNGGDEPYIYAPNRVYALDTVVLKPTLEGLMPIPENEDGNGWFETASKIALVTSVSSDKYTCSAYCSYRWTCGRYSYSTTYSTPTCPAGLGGTMLPLSVEVSGQEGVIDIEISAKSAFEYIDLRITDWPRIKTVVDGVEVYEQDQFGWKPGQSVGAYFDYRRLGNNVYRIYAYPGQPNGKWGPPGTRITVRIIFTLMGPPGTKTYFAGQFGGVSREVEVSYVGAGRRGNHRS